MKRLLITGTSLATPKLGEEELKRVLAELGAAAIFDDAAVHDFYMKLAAIHGAWLAENEAKQVPPVASALRRAGTCLIEIAVRLFFRMNSPRAIPRESKVALSIEKIGAPERIRTPDLCLRRAELYFWGTGF
jgi:hypothetical protein